MPTRRRALLSVSDKTGLTDLAARLIELGFELVSTGGTFRTLEEAGLPVTLVSDVTGFPEMLDGRLKTLHPRIQGGILADRDVPAHLEALAEHDIAPIDLVVVNLYPFREAAASPTATAREVVEQIDIGGPTLVRAAAKNHRHVTVVVDPGDYGRVLEALEGSDTAGDDPGRGDARDAETREAELGEGDRGEGAGVEGVRGAFARLRLELATKAFAHTASYDEAIATWLETHGETRGTGANSDRLETWGTGSTLDRPSAGEPESGFVPVPLFPERLRLGLRRAFVPRYGENPHQQAAVYETVEGPASLVGSGLLGGMRQHQGKELSYNNLLDADAARRLVASFLVPLLPDSRTAQAAVAIIKHGNPCGVGVGETAAHAYERALACDPMSAFGSIVAVNRPADRPLAEAMADLFVEVVLAPGFDAGALEVFGRKTNLRVLECPIGSSTAVAAAAGGAAGPSRSGAAGGGPARGMGELELRAIDGGFLVQAPDSEEDPAGKWACVTEREPTDDELAALALAWRVVRHVRSNAIVVANRLQTVGIGAGQMSRVDSCRIAIDKARLPLKGTAAASDAFFPFPDGVETLAAAGVTAVVQPGGSKKDGEVVAAANRLGVAMMVTGRRHFRH